MKVSTRATKKNAEEEEKRFEKSFVLVHFLRSSRHMKLKCCDSHMENHSQKKRRRINSTESDLVWVEARVSMPNSHEILQQFKYRCRPTMENPSFTKK